MANEVVLYELKDKIAFITLNRPEKRNAINMEMYDWLDNSFTRFENDPDARVAVLSGAGKCFCSGADVSGFGKAGGERRILSPTNWNGTKVFKPVVGAVHGYAIGAGYSLAVKGCDITVAAEGTKFAEIEAKLGQNGLEFEYVPYMPFKLSLEFFLTGEYLDAQRAYDIGLINKVVPQAQLMDEALRYAEILKNNAPLSIRSLKYAQYKAMDEAFGRKAKEQWEYDTFTKPIMESEDSKEGPRAFFEKRKPQFKGC